ncbi:TRAP transporter small permease [Tianweitania sediminis]|uniref:TRAP transporter small permease protein n=1 Tax=Tianweitania sediminis TaxID=1502156 RepID=A0A8J7UKK8_9HYPH|nr:TRAP transporter small permease [Tianweitania sediminis]MBP0439980.1 TRAP transporter small permease [Tianweitania sediminis]
MSEDPIAGEPVAVRIFRTATNVLRTVLTVSISLLLAFILLLMFAQAADRYLVGSGFSAYEQYSKIALVWLVFLGFPVAILHYESITADLIAHYLSERMLGVRDLIFNFVMAAMAGLLLFYGLPVMRVGSFMEILGTPFTYWSIYLSFNLGMALIILILVARSLAALHAAIARHNAS